MTQTDITALPGLVGSMRRSAKNGVLTTLRVGFVRKELCVAEKVELHTLAILSHVKQLRQAGQMSLLFLQDHVIATMT